MPAVVGLVTHHRFRWVLLVEYLQCSPRCHEALLSLSFLIGQTSPTFLDLLGPVVRHAPTLRPQPVLRRLLVQSDELQTVRLLSLWRRQECCVPRRDKLRQATSVSDPNTTGGLCSVMPPARMALHLPIPRLGAGPGQIEVPLDRRWRLVKHGRHQEAGEGTPR